MAPSLWQAQQATLGDHRNRSTTVSSCRHAERATYYIADSQDFPPALCRNVSISLSSLTIFNELSPKSFSAVVSFSIAIQRIPYELDLRFTQFGN